MHISNKNQSNKNESYQPKNNNSFNNAFFIIVMIVGLLGGIHASQKKFNPIIPSLLFSATTTGLVHQFMGGIQSKGSLKLPIGLEVGGNIAVLLGCTLFFRGYLAQETINPSDLKYTLGDIENPHERDIVAVFFDTRQKKVLFDDKSGEHPDLVVSNNENEIFKIQGIPREFFTNNTKAIHYDINRDKLEGIDVFRIIGNNGEKYDLGLLTNEKLEENYYYNIKDDNLLEGLKRIQKADQKSSILEEIRQQCRSYQPESFCSEGEQQVALSFTPELDKQKGYKEHDGRIGVVCEDSKFNLNQQIQLKTKNSDSLVDIVIVGKNLQNIYCKYNNFSRIQTTKVVQKELGIINTDSRGFFMGIYTPNESNPRIFLPNP